MEEDEIHGGFMFREGDRWMLHYMKWTADGHIYCGLAVQPGCDQFQPGGGGAVTLPLGRTGHLGCGPGRDTGGSVPRRQDVAAILHGVGLEAWHGRRGRKTSHFGLNAPNQVGAAEIQVGHWAHLQMRREAETGELVTTTLRLTRPHSLKVDAEAEGSQVAVFDPATGREHAGFGYAQFDGRARTARRHGAAWDWRHWACGPSSCTCARIPRGNCTGWNWSKQGRSGRGYSARVCRT